MSKKSFKTSNDLSCDFLELEPEDTGSPTATEGSLLADPLAIPEGLSKDTHPSNSCLRFQNPPEVHQAWMLGHKPYSLPLSSFQPFGQKYAFYPALFRSFFVCIL